MKRALVFSGGGSRGAYECGAWQALDELNIRIDAVYGTSIGAINAALVAQGDLDVAVKLWENISLKQIVAVEDDEDFSVDHMISRKRDIIPFILENAKNMRLDISPLENMLETSLDEGRIRASGMELGMMLTRVPQMSGFEARLSNVGQGQLKDYILASASCFPVFPMKHIGEDKYIDGGYIDNLPIGMAIEDGADEVIAVDIHPQPTHPEYGCMPFLKLINPLHDLGGFLDFNPRMLQRSRRMGYYDCMKAYGRFDGIRYTFVRVNELRILETARKFARRVAKLDAEAGGRGSEALFIGAIGAETPIKALSWKETYLRGVELAAQAMEFREDAIYDAEVLCARMLKFVEGLDSIELSDRGLSEAARGSGRMRVAYLYAAMRKDPDFAPRMVKRLAEFPGETVAALFLNCMVNSN